MADQRSPAFQFYFKDWRSSRKVQRMSFKERGMYLEMLIDQWDEGPLPQRPEDIAALIGAREAEFLKSWPTLRQCFVERDGGWINLRLEMERVKQKARKQRASDWGKDGAEKRWGKPLEIDGHPIGSPSRPDSFAIASAIASASAGALAEKTPARQSVEDEIGDRARELLENYPRWYAEERNGARIPLLGGNLQWQEAKTLCATWDDARLEKLARIVLTATDDPFISRSDRGWKIFVTKAAWADDRLKQWELSNQVAV